MKNAIILVCLLLSSFAGFSQVGIGTKNPDTTSVLDLSSTTKGLLIPRMTTVQRNAIGSPAMGLQILNLDDMCLDIYDGRQWIKNCGMKESDALQSASRSSVSDSIWTKDGDRIFPADPARIGIGTEMPDSSALMDINSTSKGFLMPRMSTAQRDLIAAPAVGLQIINLDDMCLDIYDGAGWIKNCGYQITGYDTLSAKWTPKANFLGGARTGAVGFSIGSIGYLGTGNNGVLKNDFWAYDPVSNVWSQKANVGASGRESAIGLTIPTTNGIRGFIGTGHGVGNTFLNDFWEFKPDSNKWESLSPLPGVGFYGGAAFCIDSMGYVGTGINNSLVTLSAFYKYDCTNDSWATIDPYPSPRFYATAFVYNNTAYVGTGQGSYQGPNALNFYPYDPATGDWGSSTLPLGPRRGVSTFTINGYPYLIGGNNINAYFKDVYRFNGTIFEKIADFPGDGRWQAVAFAIGNKGFIGTGAVAASSYAADFFEYDEYPIGQIYSIPPPPEPVHSFSDGLWTKEGDNIYTASSGNVGLGTNTPHAPLQFAKTTANRKIVLNEVQNNDHLFYGFGSGTNLLQYQIGSNSGSAAHAFFAGVNASSSTELMRITGNGNVGINNAMPLAPLHFNNTADNRKIVLSSVMDNDHQFYGLGSGDGQMRYQIPDDTGSVAHVFFGASSSSTSKELMRIQGDGNIGIGTSTPNELLEIGGSGRAFFGDGDGGGENNRTGLLIDGNEAGEFTRLESYNYQTQTGMNLIINSIGHGNVGIGTISPRAPLQFRNSYANRKIVLYQNVDNDYQVYGLGVNDNVMRYQVPDTFSSHILYAGTSATTSAELMRIQGNGNVGIGTPNPHAPLQFENNTASRKIVLWETTNNDNQFIGFGVDPFILRYNVDNPSVNHVFYAGTSPSTKAELMRITGTGNVGIGISNVTNKMDINGNNRTVSGHPTGRPLYVTGNISESSNGIEFRKDDGSQGLGFGFNTMYAAGSATDQDLGLNAKGSIGNLKFTTSNTERMRILGNGNVGIGTITPATKLQITNGTDANLTTNSGYLALGQTSASNIVIDDDEILARNNGGPSILYLQAVPGGSVSIGGNSQPTLPLYVTGDNILESSKGVEFRHSNQTQGIGFGYNTIYATGYNTDQDLGLMAIGSSGALKFTTNNAERMRILGNGYVGIGTTTPQYQLQLSQNSAAKPGTFGWTIFSDSRLKKDIEPFTDGLDLVRKINPIWFRYNGLNGITDTSRFAGIIAQEIQKIAPYMISTTKSASRDGESYLSYDANAMLYILVNSVKEQQTLIESQQAMIESQQMKFDELQNVNGALKSQFESSISDLQLKLMQMEAMINELKAERKP